MKKYINFLNLIELMLYIVIILVLIMANVNENYSLYFTAIYLGIIFITNLCYYTLNLLKNSKTPQISIYSTTALFAYIFSWFGLAFVNIKNHSYREFIKSANDYENMTKGQRLKSYLYYFLIWIAIFMFILFLYLDDLGINEAGIILLFTLLILIFRVFMLYDFAEKKEVKKNE